MGAQSQNLKATITFGGNIDSSWTQSTNNLNKNIKAVEKQSAQLAKQQKDLADKIKQAKLAGKDISGLKKDYDGVTREIKKTSAAQEALNRDLKKTQTLTKWAGKGIGFAKGAGTLAIAGTVAGAGLVAGSFGLLKELNQTLAGRADMASGFGVGIETLNAWDAVAGESGLSGGESLGAMFLKYSKSAGKSQAGFKSPVLEKSFDTLGFGNGAMKGLTDLEQFDKIMDRAVSMKDQTKASFAVNSLFGPDAAKVLNMVKASGLTFGEYIKKQKTYNMITQEGANGAARNSLALEKMSLVLSSSMLQIAGLIGDQLAPKIEALTAGMINWLREDGLQKITDMVLNEWLPAMVAFGKGVIFVGKIIYSVAKKLAWLMPDESEQAEQKQQLLNRVASGNASPSLVASEAEELGLKEWFETKVNNPETIQKLQTKWQTFGAEGATSEDRRNSLMNIVQPEGVSNTSPQDFDWNAVVKESKALFNQKEEIKPQKPALDYHPSLANVMAGVDQSSITPGREYIDNSKKYFTQEIYAAPGQDAQTVGDQAMKSAKSSDFFSSNNALYDIPGF